MRPILQRIALASARRYKRVFIIAALAVALAGGLITRLHLDPDILNLLPKNDPKIADFLEAMERFGGVDYLLVVVRVPEGEVPEPYELLVDRLGSRLEELPEIERADYRIGAPEELIEKIYPKAVLFLDEEGRDALSRRLTSEGITERTCASCAVS